MCGNMLKVKKRKSASLVFIHHTNFPCLKQVENTKLDAFYAMLQIQHFVKDQENLCMPSDKDQSHIRQWCNDMAKASPKVVRNNLRRIQQSLASSIYTDVVLPNGRFHAKELSKSKVQELLERQGDMRPFASLGDIIPKRPPKI